MKKLYIDFETRSTLDIKKVGAWRYAMHPSTEVMCMAWKSPATPDVQLLTPKVLENSGRTWAPPEFYEDVMVIAHNAHFEYAIWNYILHKRHGWPALWEPKYWGCTLSRAAMCNIPISLDGASVALNTPNQKDLHGRAAMLKLARPIHVDALDNITWNEDPALKAIMYEYCKKDVEAEMALDARLPELPPMERKIWELDLEINRRGVYADVNTAERGKTLAEEITKTLNAELVKLTGGAVDKASRIAAIKRYLETRGVVVGSLDKSAVNTLMADPKIPEDLKEVIKIRQQVGKSSTAKYQAILDSASPEDQRMRGLLQYHAAGTGRWGGRGPQPQNFPKGTGFDSEKVIADISGAFQGDERASEAFQAEHGDKAMDALSAALRGVLTAGPGKTLVSADYSAIEARVLMWLAGDHFALAKYKMGVNLYVDMARFIYDNDKLEKKDAKEYAIGKSAVLGCGYGMGHVKFLATCQANGIDVTEEMAKTAVQAYRKKYKKVVEMWYAQEAAARSAVRSPGTVHPCGKVVWGMDPKREFLVCRLPSGRHLRYFKPSLKSIETPYGEKEEIHYWAAGNTGLEQFKTYGGSLVENITQATARDIMANGMLNAEAAGFRVVLTVHDELVTELDVENKIWDDKGAVEALAKEMCSLPQWAAGCPIAAEGWTGKRYRK